MIDNGFSKACPSGNHMTEGNNDRPLNIHIGDVFRDENGVEWEVDDFDGDLFILYPCEDQRRVYKLDELIDEMEKL